jgi:hypothetical protein
MLAAANPYNPCAAQPRYPGNDFELARFVSFRDRVAFGQHLFGK